MVTRFEGVSEDDLTDRSAVQMMDLILAYFGSFSLTEFTLGKIEGWNATSGWSEAAIQLDGASQLVVRCTHEADWEIWHVKVIEWVVSPAGRWREKQAEKLLAKLFEMAAKGWTFSGGKSQDSALPGWGNKQATSPIDQASSGNTGGQQ
jgi:hypothetical protein